LKYLIYCFNSIAETKFCNILRIKNIIRTSFSTIFLIVGFLSVAQSNVENLENNTAFVIFDSNSFYAEPNAIAVFTEIIVPNDQSNKDFIVSSVMRIKMSFETSKNNIVTKVKKVNPLIQKKYLPKPPVVAKKTTNEDLIIPLGKNPLNNFWILTVNNSLGVVSTTTYQLKKTNLHSAGYLQNSKFDQFCLVEPSRSTKKAFQSHEIVFTASNYSKTSRIRPPPSPEGGVANC